MTRSRRWAILAIAFFLTAGATDAQAAIVSGSVTDRRGDGNREYGLHPNDIARFGVQYDSDAGQLTTSITLNDELVSPLADYSFGAQMGFWNPRRNACDVESTGAATVEILPSLDAPIDYDTAVYSVVGYSDGAEQTFLVHSPPDKWFEPPAYVANRTRFDRITDAAAFAGRGYNCVTTILLTGYAAYPSGGAFDSAKRFCLGPMGTIPCSKARRVNLSREARVTTHGSRRIKLLRPDGRRLGWSFLR